MAQFEEYLERKKKDQGMEYRWDQQQREIKEQKFEVGMDSDELIDYYADRLENTTFRERTSYYFENAGLMANKSLRYKSLSKGELNVEEFAARHKNHSADKRKKSAGKAAEAFGKASLLADKYRKKAVKNHYELYTRRDEIMRLRMEGMVQAAETKSTSDENEIYLKSKAKISCLMILYDQIRNLTKEAKLKGDQKSVEKLEKKKRDLSKELKKVQKDMRENLPTTDDKWKEENGIREWKAIDMVEHYRRDANQPNIYENDVKTMWSYKTIRAHAVKYKMDFPCNVVRLDKNGQPISLREAKKQDWNRRYRDAVEKNDEATKNRMDLEAIKRIENYELPPIKSFETDMNTLFRRHPAEYYEMFISAPMFIADQMKKGGAVKEYIEANPVLKKKIDVMNTLAVYLRESLLNSCIDLKSANFTMLRRDMSQRRLDEHLEKIVEGYKDLTRAVKKRNEDEEKKKLSDMQKKASDYMKKNRVGADKDGN